MIFNMSGNMPITFSVNKYTEDTLPEAATENSIAILTDAEITEWYISASAPEAKEGAVWIVTGTSSVVAFSAIRKNILMVYPISAKQYIGEKWEDRKAKIYQGGEWKEFVTYWYQPGNECIPLTGGYVSGSSNSIVESTDNYIRIRGGYADTNATMCSKKSIDISPYQKLFFRVKQNNLSKNSNDIPPQVGLHTEPNLASSDKLVAFANVAVSETETLYSVDVSKLSGKYHIAARGYRVGTVVTSMTITEIYGQ